jgi:UDP-GlcNAc:undecaprenyl-phosphate GlcNAc-1-phosphate transferase
MLSFVLILVISFLISVVGTPVVRNLAVAFGALDHAHNSRKIHGSPVPRLGGLAILLAVNVALCLGLLVPSVRAVIMGSEGYFLGLAIAADMCAALGTYDDLRGVTAKKKFAVQVGVALLLYCVGFRIDRVDTLLGLDLALGAVSLPLTLLWIVGVSNAINLIDGLDGLAGGLSLVVGVAMFCMAAHNGDLATMLVTCALAGALAGFLVYNVNPASIFMGDSGSLFLGTLLAALPLWPHDHGTRAVPLLALIIALGIPIADTLLAFARRATRGLPVFSADREHLHHRLLDLGLSHRQAVISLWAAATLLAAASVHFACGTGGRLATLLATALAALVVLWKLGMLSLANPEIDSRRRRNRARLMVVRSASRRLRTAARVADVSEELMAAAAPLDAEALSLRLAGAGQSAHQLRDAGNATAVMTRFMLDAARPEMGSVEVLWRREQPTIDRDVEVAFEVLCGHVASAINRIQSRTPAHLQALRGRGIHMDPQSPHG